MVAKRAESARSCRARSAREVCDNGRRVRWKAVLGHTIGTAYKIEAGGPSGGTGLYELTSDIDHCRDRQVL